MNTIMLRLPLVGYDAV